MSELKNKHKRVRRLETGVYTIEPESVRKRNDHLCQICSIAGNCPVQTALKLTEGHAEAIIRTCARFVPSIPFRKPYVGLHFPLFNTLRAGTTWRDRLVVGKVVALTDSATGEILRFGRVQSVISGGVDRMLEIHSQFNHIAMANRNVAEVEKVIRKSYGHFLKPDSQLTAIYIEGVTNKIIDDIDNKLGTPPARLTDNVINMFRHK